MSASEMSQRKPWYLRRWTWAIVLVLALGYVGSLTNPEKQSAASTQTTTAAASSSLTASPTQEPEAVAATSATQAAGVAEVAALLAALPAKGRAAKTGYDRDLFGVAWTDDVSVEGGHNGCDTRNDILRRDLASITLKPGSNGCKVLTGSLQDPYTSTTIEFLSGEETSASIQIDHVVALSDAWQKGAQQLAPELRADFANDPLNLQAVDGPTNQAKGDGDAATWLPPNKEYRCTYVARQVQVKAKYGLWVTAAERDAITTVLAACDVPPTTTAVPVPALSTPAPSTTQAPAPTTTVEAPAPQPTTVPPPPPPTAQSNVYYNNCSEAKAAGAAPLYVNDPGYRSGLDSDSDGVACE